MRNTQIRTIHSLLRFLLTPLFFIAVLSYKFRFVEISDSRHANSIPQDFEECVTFPKKKAAHDLMKPPKLSLAISSTASITPAPAVISTRKTSIAIMMAMEFQVC